MLDQCAACGKESDSHKTCSGCNAVKYCNAECQMEHRKQHKADCKKKAAEFEVALFEIGKRAAELLDEILSKKPPPKEDCPICMLPLPCREYTAYQPCCGKTLCCGCVGAMEASYTCPFRRKTVSSSEEEEIRRLNIRMEAGDADACDQMGVRYRDGFLGLKQDKRKALEMFLRAAELGSVYGRNNIATMYYEGSCGLKRDLDMAVYHFQQAAIRGSAKARYNLGIVEDCAGETDRAKAELNAVLLPDRRFTERENAEKLLAELSQ